MEKRGCCCVCGCDGLDDLWFCVVVNIFTVCVVKVVYEVCDKPEDMYGRISVVVIQKSGCATEKEDMVGKSGDRVRVVVWLCRVWLCERTVFLFR